MAYSNNAENIYSFRINRVEPLHIPLLSRLTGPFRYDFWLDRSAGTPICQGPIDKYPNVTRGPLGTRREDQLPAHREP
jgi:hypothetical protein